MATGKQTIIKEQPMECSVEKIGGSGSRRHRKQHKHSANVKIILNRTDIKDKCESEKQKTENKQQMMQERRTIHKQGEALVTIHKKHNTEKTNRKSANEKVKKCNCGNKQSKRKQ